jgi:hypothetical protein
VRNRRDAVLGARCLDLLQRLAEVVAAVETSREAIGTEEARSGEFVLVVVEDDRVRIERHGVLLAIDVHRFPRRRRKAVGAEAHRGHVVGRDFGQRALAHGQRNARGVVGHQVRAFAHGGGRLHLGVERHAPVESRRLDFDLAGVCGIEVVDELLHPDAVAATQEVPPHHGFLRQCAAHGGAKQCRAEQRGANDLADHV